MKVKELIETLEGFDPEDEVHIAYNYGDYWKTMVAPEVRSVETMPVKHSSYHRMPKLVEDEDWTDEPVVVVISAGAI